MGFMRTGGLALAIAMTVAGGASAATPFNLGPGFSVDVKVDAAGKAHAAWIEERAENAQSPSQIHYCRIAVGTEACEAKALGGPPGVGNYPHSVGAPLEIFLNPVDGKPRVFHGCYNCYHGGAQTSELIVATSGTSMARRTTGADPGGVVGDVRTGGLSAYDAATGALVGTNAYDFLRMPTPDPADTPATRLSPYEGGSSYLGATGVTGTGASQVQVAVYIGRTSTAPRAELRFLTHTGIEGVNTAANWQGGADSIGGASEMSIDSAGSGVTLLTSTSTLHPDGPAVQFRRFNATTKTFTAPITIAAPVATGDKAPDHPDIFEAPNGRLYATWHDSGRIRFSTSADGTTWTFPETVANTDVVDDLHVAGNGEADKGFVVWNTDDYSDGVVKAAALSPLLPMVCPGDPRCPVTPQEPPQKPQEPQQPPPPPQAPPGAVVKKGTLGQYKWAIKAPSACVPAGARIHLAMAVAKRKLSKQVKKKLKGKLVKPRSLSLWRGGVRLALSKKSPLKGFQDSTTMQSGAIPKYQMRIVYRRGSSKKNKLLRITVGVRIC